MLNTCKHFWINITSSNIFQVLAIILFIGSAYCWPSQSKKCGLSETRSLFDESNHINRQDLIFMTEFSRFMNHKAPELLQVIQFYNFRYNNQTKKLLPIDMSQAQIIRSYFILIGVLSQKKSIRRQRKTAQKAISGRIQNSHTKTRSNQGIQ